MSAEAQLAVMEHATGSDAEWRMLAVLASEANGRGLVVGVSMELLAARVGKSERGAAAIKGRLKASGQLVVLDEGGGRSRTAVYALNLPGLDAADDEETLNVDSPQAESPAPTTATASSSGSKKGKDREFYAVIDGLIDTKIELGSTAVEGGEGQMVLDGLGLLRQGKKVDSKLVTPTEMGIAAAALASFNRLFEWKRPNGAVTKGSDYGLGANLTSIVMRLRDRPSWDAAKHVRLVEAAWKVRWWERDGASNRRPHPNVIWGGKSFDNVVQDAADLAAGEDPKAIKKRRYTRG